METLHLFSKTLQMDAIPLSSKCFLFFITFLQFSFPKQIFGLYSIVKQFLLFWCYLITLCFHICLYHVMHLQKVHASSCRGISSLLPYTIKSVLMFLQFAFWISCRFTKWELQHRHAVRSISLQGSPISTAISSIKFKPPTQPLCSWNTIVKVMLQYFSGWKAEESNRRVSCSDLQLISYVSVLINGFMCLYWKAADGIQTSPFLAFVVAIWDKLFMPQ